MSDQVDSMSVRMFLRNRMGIIDSLYLEHEGSAPVGGIVHCHCGYRAQEPEWLLHVADKIADAIQGPTVVELPFAVDDVTAMGGVMGAPEDPRFWGRLADGIGTIRDEHIA